MIDGEYIKELYAEQAELVCASMEAGFPVQTFSANLGVEHDSSAWLMYEWVVENLEAAIAGVGGDLVAAIAVMVMRMFELGIVAGRDPAQDPRVMA